MGVELVTRQIIWNLPTPLDPGMLVHDDPPPTLVQFSGSAPSDEDHRILGEFLASHPATTVRLYGADLSPDLDYLRHYWSVARINIDVQGIGSFEPLRVLRPDLEELTLGPCGRRRLSLAPLEHFTSLRQLVLVRHDRDIDVIGRLRTLQRLTLVSLKLPDLNDFRTLSALWSFALKLGGTTNLKALPEMGHLRYLEIWRVNGLSDLSIIRELHELEYLFLQHLKKVENLPSLAPCQRLRRVHLDRVRIHDLEAIAAAPQLEELLLLDMPQLREAEFRVLLGHPTLRAVTAGVHNEKRRAAIRAMLGLNDVPSYGTDFQFSSGERVA